MKVIKQTYKIKAPVAKVWDALVNPKLIEEWTNSKKPVMDDQVGTEFKLWDDSIWGKNLAVKPEKLLKQEWYGGKWAKPSIVTMELSEKDGTTTVELIHTDYPEDEADDFADGWKTYYFGPIKELLEK